MKRTATLLIILILITAFTSCKIDTKAAKAADIYPTMILSNATYTYGQPGRKPLVMNAEEITVWEENRKTELHGVTFIQNGDDGEIELTGSCDYAVTYNNETVSMSGNIHLEKKTDNIVINCNSLNWNDSKQIIETKDIVSVSYKDGTEITAEGFKAYLDRNVYEFTKIISGSYTNE